MDIKILILPVIVIIAVAAFLFWQSGNNEDHELVFHFEDGTTSSLSPFGIKYEDKNVVSITYQVTNENYDTSQYEPYFDTPQGIYHLVSHDNGTWNIPIYELINYSVDDGIYTLKLVPDGILYENGEPVQLLDEIVFAISVSDDRHVGIIFE